MPGFNYHSILLSPATCLICWHREYRVPRIWPPFPWSRAGFVVNTGTAWSFPKALGLVAVVLWCKGCSTRFPNYKETGLVGGVWAESKRPTSCFHIAGRRCVHLFLYRNDSFSACGVVCVVASALASRAVRLFPVRRERNGQLLLPTRCALRWLCFVSESASSSVSVTLPLSFFESCCELFCFGEEKEKLCAVTLAEIV